MNRFNTNEEVEVTYKSIATDIIYSDSNKQEQVDLIIKALTEEGSKVTVNEATYKALKTELTASKIMIGVDGYAQGWNAAMDKALRFLKMYADGEGLFQI
jgi:hypothetical protein